MAETNAAMGQRLRELRLRRGLQQSEVARRLKISPAYLSLIEKGKRVVQLPLLFQALELYGVAVEDFMGSLGERRVDDGLAKLLDTDSNLTTTGQVLGTPSYMSPEQAGAKAEETGPLSDVYSLGSRL